MNILIILLAFFIIITTSILIVSYVIYKMSFYHLPEKTDRTLNFIKKDEMKPYALQIKKLYNKMIKEQYQRIYIKSYDGLILSAQYYCNNPGGPIDILVHGYKSFSIKDFSGGYFIAKKKNHNVLLIDQRAHSKSQGDTITFGIKESKDVVSWIKYLNKRFGNTIPISLIGISMGAATVLNASARNLPNNVKLVIADSPFSSSTDIIVKVANDRGYPNLLIRPLLYISSLLFCGCNINESAAINAVQNTNLPILLIHSEKDAFVPHHMSIKIANTNPKIEFYSFQNAPHGLSYLEDTNKYEEIVSNFIDKHLN